MARNKSSSGVFDDVFKDLNEPQEQVAKEPVNIPEPEPTPKVVEPVKKVKTKPREKGKRGRPPIEGREKKVRKNITILPSVYDKAAELAESQGLSLSEVIENLLREYIEEAEEV